MRTLAWLWHGARRALRGLGPLGPWTIRSFPGLGISHGSSSLDSFIHAFWDLTGRLYKVEWLE